MTLRYLMATFHIVALAIGFLAVITRAHAFRDLQRNGNLARVFGADNLWALAAVLWLGTGLTRAFGGLEKGTAYYLAHPLFHAKLGLFVLIVLLELWPMMSLIRWRRATRRGEAVDTSRATVFARVSVIQGGIVLVMVFLATAIARGMGR